MRSNAYGRLSSFEPERAWLRFSKVAGEPIALRASGLGCIKRAFYACSMLLSLCTGVATASASEQPLPISEVVSMSTSGLPPQKQIERIHDTRTSYALRGSDFAKLKAAGVSDAVLDYLQQSFVDDVDLLTLYWVTGEGLGGGSAFYPQPADVEHMVSGYGTASHSAPGRYLPSLPPGVPDWVSSDLAPFSAKRISVSDILAMSRRGDSDSQIIDQLHNAQLQTLGGAPAPKTIRTRPLAPISGSELARLKDEGLSDAVLDELQSRFLGQYVALERLRYQNAGKKK